LPYGTEPVTIISLPTGTYNFDLINGSIRYATDIANANVTINFRGNSTVTANSIVANQHSIIGTYMMTNGNTAYGISSIQIDGVSQTIKWINGVSPVIANNAIMVYSFTCIKTANTPTYTVLASGTRYL
jgi:hypothetical protein